MRYAIYFTPPPDEPLTRLAAAWLGRDAFGGQAPPFPHGTGFSRDEAWEITAEPRRYGFHATLKAPFRLAPERDEAVLLQAFDAFCAARAPFDLPPLRVRQIGRFLALVPEASCAALEALAADAVSAFEPFRAELEEAEIARRKPENLSSSERDNLRRWGYPYVFADFRFHMTLTGPLGENEARRALESLEALFSRETLQAVRVHGLGLFREPAAGSAFDVRSFRPLARI